MLARKLENKDKRTVPLHTAGQSLLSGNAYCGHCGGRLVLTTNGKIVRHADGAEIRKKRIRYVCYRKTRRRFECDGQTGYTMHILDGMIEDILHQVFRKMQAASDELIVGTAFDKKMSLLRAALQRAKSENAVVNREYESLKAEVMKSVQGTSLLPADVLSEMLNETREKLLVTSRKITELNEELADGSARMEKLRAEYQHILSWSEIFDKSGRETQKMICAYIIKRVTVRRDYQLDVEFTINVQQFLHGARQSGTTEPREEILESQQSITQPKLRSNRKELKFCIVFANFICGLPTDKT